ncbi:hypothetical protein Q5P01_025268 [Channa striata]|uniref:Uncharacterized protein n=1 Tax=Channa striata TaxID=64152 RepID=A0AA88IIB2_CHASR|nr:hypothetical protein Q5P01_025268 [Channa striata]
MALCKILAVVAGGGVSSGSAEALANGGGNNNRGAGAAGNNANPGVQNGLPLNGEPLVGTLVQLGGSLFIQPVGNLQGQAPLQQLIPVGALPQGGAFLVGQTGGANVSPQAQVAQAAQATRGGPVTLFALLSQRNAGGDPQGAVFTPGQVQLIPLTGLNNQQQAGAAGGTAGRLRFQRSAAARLRMTQQPLMKVTATEEEEECSGMDVEENQMN